MKNVVILGAGIAGLTSAFYLKDKYKVVILEKSSVLGGLCQSFQIDDFWFDYGAHAAFTKNEIVRELMEKDIRADISLSEAMNYKSGKWIRQPVQNNLYELDIKEKIEIIKGFIHKKDDGKYRHYGEWLQKKYGVYFAQNYPYLYTEKYWTVNPELLETKWIGPRMYTPSIDEILYGSYTKETPNVHYAGEIRYPTSGGFAQYLQNLSKDVDIIYNAEVVQLCPDKKCIRFNEQVLQYDEIVSTIPLPELIKIICNVPHKVMLASKKLNCTSLVLVSLGIQKEDVMPNHAKCFYIYDKDILASRVYSTSEYGRQNAPEACSTIQAEIYFSNYKPMTMSLQEIENQVIEDLVQMGLFKKENIAVHNVKMKKYANIMFTQDIYDNRSIVHQFLDEQGIGYAGRFGEWDYFWSDQSVLSGKRAAEKLLYDD